MVGVGVGIGVAVGLGVGLGFGEQVGLGVTVGQVDVHALTGVAVIPNNITNSKMIFFI